jgi:hypothetical protein
MRAHELDQSVFKSVLPADIDWKPFPSPHFHWAKSGEYVTQVTAIGPISLEYVDPEDDPRGSEPSGTNRNEYGPSIEGEDE